MSRLITTLYSTLFTALLTTFVFSSSAHADGAIKVIDAAPFAEGAKIKKKIVNECTQLGSKLSSFIVSYSAKNGITIDLVESIDTGATGKVLEVEIVDAVSRGNAFIGHSKFVGIEGTLYENGKELASFSGERSSGGGFGAGYKGSCSVLGRCVKTLGKDIARWLQNPEDGADIGE